MTSKIFIILFLFFINLDRAIAACESDRQAALRICDENNIKEPLRLIEKIKLFAQEKDSGAVPSTEYAMTNSRLAGQALTDFEKKCYDSFTKCVRTCEQESQIREANMDEAGAQQASQAAQECSAEPQRNYQAAKKGNMDLSQIMPLLGALLGQLKGSSGESTDPCEKNSALCKTDTAAQSPGATLSNNTTRQGTGETFEQGLNPTDMPSMGEAAAPSLAQGTPGMGGGGGINTAGMGGGPSRGGRGVAEINADGTPKINLASAPGGAAKSGGSLTPSNPQSPAKGSGNPIASRVSIDGDGGPNGTAALVNKAMQARGVASENGQVGGVTAAHAFDNFQKIEKRIQVERNHLGEL